jgi:cation-transporting ATPase I
LLVARAEPRVVRASPGRVRLHLAGLAAAETSGLARALGDLTGVLRASASATTRNVLVEFDPGRLDIDAVLAHAGDLVASSRRAATPHAGEEVRVRLRVPGLQDDAALAARLVERLEQLPGVRHASASPLTGRALVLYDPARVDAADLAAEIARLAPKQVRAPKAEPARPATSAGDGGVQLAATRLAAAALGLGLLTARRALGRAGAPTSAEAPVVAAALLSVADGVRPVRGAVRAVIGEWAADATIGSAAIAAHTLAGKTLGLSVSAAASLRALTALRPQADAWRAYADRGGTRPVEAGARVRLAARDRAPTDAIVVEGFGTATGPDGLPLPRAPGDRLAAGVRVFGGPLLVELQPTGAAPVAPRPVAAPGATDVYAVIVGAAALAAALATTLLTRSPGATLMALQLLSAKPALHAREAAGRGAAARAVRAGAVVVGSGDDRPLRRPDVVLLDAPRALTDDLELVRAVALGDRHSASEVAALAGDLATAAGSPWGRALRATRDRVVADVSFDGRSAEGRLDGAVHRLAPPRDAGELPARARPAGDAASVVLTRDGAAVGVLILRPRLAPGVQALVDSCRRCGAHIAVARGGAAPPAARELAARAGVELLDTDDVAGAVRAIRQGGARVALLADGPAAGAALGASDLAIGLWSGRSGRFTAPADVLAPDLAAAAAVIDAAARSDLAVRDGLLAAIAANVAGVVWGLRGRPTVASASRPASIASAAALGVAFLRLAGGTRPRSVVSRLTDPHPERWGRVGVDQVLAAFNSAPGGLSEWEAARRRRQPLRSRRPRALGRAVGEQFRSPANAVLGAGAMLSLSVGAMGDVAMIAAVVAANAAVEAWQEHRANDAARALERLAAPDARVLRDGRRATVAATDVVPGDVLLLSPGDHVAADARVLAAGDLQVDEAALTGESMPVAKSPDNGTDESRIVLHGSDVTVGSGQALVVAVGRDTRLGSIAAALDADDERPSPLALRLQRMMREGLPVVAAAGALVAVAGILRGRPARGQLAVGASVAIAAVPEGLPLLASVASAGVARRLASHHALMRSLSAADALGRVDVACADKTGTLTHGRLAVRVVAGPTAEADPAPDLPPELRAVLLAGAQASPHPDAEHAGAHPTDLAVLDAAERAGLGAEARTTRKHESAFDPARAFHAAAVDGGVRAKGAVEVLLPRCRAVRSDGAEIALDAQGAARLHARADELAGRGLRVLMVAEGTGDPADPRDLVALGFLGIADPLRPGVGIALRRCRQAGVRVLMLTGDHVVTARAIAREAGLADDGETVLTGPEIAELDPAELDERLERATVVARITPLEKLRIVESLQRCGHTVAMTGDGVNDAPALRLADVGVAMGRNGTEVARQAADVILTEDDFRVLTEALIEGRGFWRNMRRALALLLGGNLGEVGFLLGAAVLGLPSPLSARQILAVNLISDVLPAMAVAMQPPEHRDLPALAREGAEALDHALRRDIVRHAALTALPALGAYALAVARIGAPAARTVGFGAVCTTQLALALAEGHSDDRRSRSVTAAVGATAGVLGGALALQPARAFLGLAAPGLLGWLLVVAAAAVTARLASPSAAGGSD